MFSLVTKEVRLVTKNVQRPFKYAYGGLGLRYSAEGGSMKVVEVFWVTGRKGWRKSK
jgi:hypothetical protein